MATILLVDDDLDVLYSTADLLKDEKHRVKSTPMLDEAIRIAKNTLIDLLITDKTIGGIHRGVVPLLNYMREEKPFVPVIIMSGEDGSQARKELYCHEFYEKGEIRKLVTVVKQVLKQF